MLWCSNPLYLLTFEIRTEFAILLVTKVRQLFKNVTLMIEGSPLLGSWCRTEEEDSAPGKGQTDETCL